jgi:hypothetical protein
MTLNGAESRRLLSPRVGEGIQLQGENTMTRINRSAQVRNANLGYTAIEKLIDQCANDGRALSNRLAQAGRFEPLRLFYSTRALLLSPNAPTESVQGLEPDQWRDTGIEIPASVPLSSYYSIVRRHAAHLPIL